MQFKGDKKRKKGGKKENKKEERPNPTQEHSSFSVTFQESADRHKVFCVTFCLGPGMTGARREGGKTGKAAGARGRLAGVASVTGTALSGAICW